MPIIKNIDSFIELSTDLLQAYPNTSLLSITYTNVSKKSKAKKASTSSGSGSTTDSAGITKKSNATNCVNVKLYEPNAGKTLKYKTYKIKELSRLLAFIGPRGVNIGDNHVHGLSSIMSNVKYEEPQMKEVEEGGDNDATTSGTVIREGTPAGEDVDRGSPAPVSKASKSKSKNKKKKKKN